MLYMNTVETGGDTSSSDAYSKGQGFIDQLKELRTAFNDYVVNAKDLTRPFENSVKMFTHMQDSATSIQRSMGGVAYSFKDPATGKFVSNMGEIQNKLMDSFKSTQGINASFEDSVKVLSSLATAMGRIVNPSTEVLENMVDLSKSTQLTSEEVGAMVGAMVRFGGNQKEATVTMSKLAGEARKVGINTKSYMKEVSDNMKLLNGFGFKSGVEGVKKMAKEALTLRSTIEKIGATKFQNSILDPEGAIEAAANIQMLGGAVGKLADPFQLMYMAQSDVAGLQTELLNASKAAFTFNTETGGFDASTEDLYRLREMAKATNTDFDGLVEAGREAQKLDYISSKFDLSTIPKESQGLLASLAEIDKNGKVSIDLPGYEEGQQSLEQMMKDPVFVDKLKEYNEQSMLSEKEIAQHSLSISEEQARDVNIIKNAIVLGLDKTNRDELNKTLKDSNATAKEAITATSVEVADQLGNELSPLVKNLATETNKAVNNVTGYGSPEDISKQDILAGTIKLGIKAIKEGLGGVTGNPTKPIPVKDMFIPANGGAPKVMAANKIFQGIVGDDVVMGTNLREGLNMAANKVAGKIDININIGGSVGGDSSNNINKIFEDPKVQKQIMDTVLYKLESYKKQQGVLA
jgi:hypothetical protein